MVNERASEFQAGTRAECRVKESAVVDVAYQAEQQVCEPPRQRNLNVRDPELDALLGCPALGVNGFVVANRHTDGVGDRELENAFFQLVQWRNRPRVLALDNLKYPRMDSR